MMNEYNNQLHGNSRASAFENARALRKAQTKAELLLWDALRNQQVRNLKFRRQHPFDNYILDFYNHELKLAIEVDGEIHHDPDVVAYDEVRTQNLNEQGITVLRFSNDAVEYELGSVIKAIEDWTDAHGSIGEKRDNVSSTVFSPLSPGRGAGGEVNSRIQTLFSTRKKDILNIYCTAGFPERDSTLVLLKALQDSGADMIELGMPYSDPLADGPVIQESSSRAIANGMSIPVLLEQLNGFRNTIRVPVVLMGYMNPVLQYGFEKFCAEAAGVGIDGLILPDLPVHEFESEYGEIIKRYGLDFTFLVTPETSDERIRKLDALSSGFLYAVSSSSTTGNNKPLEEQAAYFAKLRDMDLRNPVLIGFGIRDKHSYESACRFGNGAIIGSAYIRALQTGGDPEQSTRAFMKAIRP